MPHWSRMRVTESKMNCPMITLSTPDIVPDGEWTPYHVSVFTAARSTELRYYRAPLKERLPIIPIPLRATDKDVLLDLQHLIDLCHERGRYDDIDYSQPLRPALESDEKSWIESALQSMHTRTDGKE